MEFEGHDRLLRSSSYTLEKSEEKISSDSLAVEESNGNSKISSHSNEPLTTQKEEESGLNFEDSKYIKLGKDMVPEDKVFEDCSDSHCDSKAFSCTKDAVNAKIDFLFSIPGIDMANAFPMKDHLAEEANGVLNAKEEIKQMDLQSGHEKNKMESRLGDASEI